MRLRFPESEKGRLTALFSGVGFLVTFMLVGPAMAQGETASIAGVQVEYNRAIPNFPEGITFQFKARIPSGGPVFKRVELAYRVEGEVATKVRRLSFTRPDTLEAEFFISNREEYFPPGCRLSYYWLLADDQGERYETPRQEFSYQDNRFNFRELKSGLLTVRWYQGDTAFGQAVVSKAQATIDRLGQLYKIKPDRPITLTIYPDLRTMFTALPYATQDWVGGQTIPEVGTIVLALKPGDGRELGRSVPHEIAHQVIFQATRNPYNVPPKWLDEGLAVNSQEQLDSFLQQAFEQARQQRMLYPLRVLNNGFPAETQSSFVAYGQSMDIVRYIIGKYGNSGIERILAAFKRGVSYSEAIEIGLGLTLDQLDHEWKAGMGY